MIVVDASLLVCTLADDDSAGDLARMRLRGETLVAPELIDLEVLSALRRRHRHGRLDARRSRFARTDLAELPMRRVTHRPLLERCWELRDNLTAYDAAYVALAELLGVSLVTLDRRLSRAAGPRCPVELLG